MGHDTQLAVNGNSGAGHEDGELRPFQPLPPTTIEVLLRSLEGEIRGEVSSARSVREQHCSGETHHNPQPSDLVVFASSTEDVQATVRICSQMGVPLIPFGCLPCRRRKLSCHHGS